MSLVLMTGLLAMGAAERCPPAAVVSGEASLVAALEEALLQRGVGAATEQCDFITVGVTQHDRTITLEIERPGEPTIVRTAITPKRAATIIESWVRSDLAAPLLVGRRVEAPRRRPAAVPQPEPRSQKTQVHDAPEQRWFTIGVGGVVGRASDRSTWSGIDLRGCFQVGAFCFGGRAQYAVDLELAGEADDLGGDRSFIDVGLTADLPLVFGSLELQPGIAVGQAIMQSERVVDGTTVEDDTGGIRLRAQLGVGWRFDDRVSARVEFAIDYAPFAKPELYEALVDDGPETVRLPAEPNTIGWLRLGVELGGI